MEKITDSVVVWCLYIAYPRHAECLARVNSQIDCFGIYPQLIPLALFWTFHMEFVPTIRGLYDVDLVIQDVHVLFHGLSRHLLVAQAVGSDFHRAIVATDLGEKLLIGYKEYAQLQFCLFLCSKITFVLRKINKKLLTPELHFLTSICTKSFAGCGFAPHPTGGLIALPRPVATFRGLLLKGGKRKGNRRMVGEGRRKEEGKRRVEEEREDEERGGKGEGVRPLL